MNKFIRYLNLDKYKRQKETSIKWRIFICLLGFTIVILLVLAIFQTVLLDPFYKAIKINEIKQSARGIEANIDNENVSALVARVAQNSQMCVVVIDLEGETIYDAAVIPDCMVHLMTANELIDYVVLANQNKGEYLERFNREAFKNNHYNSGNYQGIVPEKDKGMDESILYTRLIQSKGQTKYAIFINSNISPVNSTVQTIRIQLGIVSVIMLIFALFLALLIAKIITKPIDKINTTSKQLAKGDYSINFETSGYKEIAQLGSTLNYVTHELSKVDELRRELIANISHDLRTPLTMITGYAEVMRDLPDENTSENVQVIIDEGRRLSLLVNDVLNISQLQSGSQKLNITNYNFTQSVCSIISRVEKLIGQDGYIIDFNYDEEVFVDADEIKISQVVYNLINNAITYTGEDKRVIVNQLSGEDFIGIEVIDSGEGIEQDKLNDIWDRYYKVPKEHKRSQIGTGLGLSIVKSILTLHKAKYGVKSSVGKGSLFWFKLNK